MVYYITLLKDFMNVSKGIDRAIQEEFDFWAPNKKPPITCMFGEIGSAFYEEAISLDTTTIAKFLDLVERGMLSDNEEYRTAIATGLIEAMVNDSCSNIEPWRYIEPFMGKESLDYAEGWRNYDFNKA